jgi:exodeoxyribonuclease-3
MRILSWNINGLRAVAKKGFLEWLQKEQADIVCIQETKIQRYQISEELLNPEGYHCYLSCAERKGYSGVLTYSKREPEQVEYGFGIPHFDVEGRIIITKFPNFSLLNIYFPNGKRDQERLDYKMAFYDATLDLCNDLRDRGEKLVISGDYNTAHKEIDLANPKENETISGFLPIERAWIDKFVANGYVDTFRLFHSEPDQYSWWTYRFKARERNIGWRIDYHFISEDLVPAVKDAFIMQDIMGSDHCPVGLELEFES